MPSSKITKPVKKPAKSTSITDKEPKNAKVEIELEEEDLNKVSGGGSIMTRGSWSC